MPRNGRTSPRERTLSWPDTAADDPVGEVARQFVLRLREAIGERSGRSAARAAGISHATLMAILNGSTWPDGETVAKLERGLEADLWPGRIETDV